MNKNKNKNIFGSDFLLGFYPTCMFNGMCTAGVVFKLRMKDGNENRYIYSKMKVPAGNALGVLII